MFDITFGGAFGAGLLSFLSPCVLPMVPFYLSYLAGVSVHDVADGTPISDADRRRAVLSALAFAFGVITVFVGLGATASLFGQMLRDWFDALRWIAAAGLLLMGLHFLGVVRIGLLNRQVGGGMAGRRGVSLAGAYLVGLAFAFGWTPCVGPVLASILLMAGLEESAAGGATLLAVYGAGMTLPFVLAAGLMGPFMRWLAGMRAHLAWVERITGAALVLFAVLIATNGMSAIAFWLLETVPAFGAIG